MADTADARVILAEGALELGRMKGALKGALTVFKKPLEGAEDWPVDFADEIAKLEVAADALEAAWVAVRIRFPQDSRVVKELAAAHEDTRELMAKYVQARQRDGHRGRDEPEEGFAAVWNTSLDFDTRREGYSEAAQQAVGVDLGQGRDPSKA
jgi:hypothetical protein